MFVSDVVKQQLAPTGVLRAGINLSNFLLVSGTTADGSPKGISPDIANLVASTLGLPCKLVCFDRPGELADAVNQDIWDIGNIAFEAERAQTLDFSHPYVVIEANFLVRHDDDFLTNDDVDRAGAKIAVSERSAYDLSGLPIISAKPRLFGRHQFRQRMICFLKKRLMFWPV